MSSGKWCMMYDIHSCSLSMRFKTTKSQIFVFCYRFRAKIKKVSKMTTQYDKEMNVNKKKNTNYKNKYENYIDKNLASFIFEQKKNKKKKLNSFSLLSFYAKSSTWDEIAQLHSFKWRVFVRTTNVSQLFAKYFFRNL